jgi:hypothetical protein
MVEPWTIIAVVGAYIVKVDLIHPISTTHEPNGHHLHLDSAFVAPNAMDTPLGTNPVRFVACFAFYALPTMADYGLASATAHNSRPTGYGSCGHRLVRQAPSTLKVEWCHSHE